MIKIKWHGELFPDSMGDLEKIVIEDIESNLQDLENPSSLIFHTVFLGKEDWKNGPGVIVWGEEGDDHYHCEYHASLSFESLDEEKLDSQPH